MRPLVWVWLSLAACACGGSSQRGVAEGAGGHGGVAGSDGVAGSVARAGSAAMGGGADAGGTAGVGGSAGSPEGCAQYVPQAAAGDIAKTPRANAPAEVLAIEASGELVAPEALYVRVAVELAAIEKLEPRVVNIRPFSSVFEPSILLGLDESAWRSLQADNYHAWDCPNHAYGVTNIEELSSISFVALMFGDKRYNTTLLMQEYGALSGITGAEPNLGGDAPDVCLEVQGDQHFYIYDQADGDCPAGCIEHRYFGFEAGPEGSITALGVFDPSQPDPEPAWFGKLSACREWL